MERRLAVALLGALLAVAPGPARGAGASAALHLEQLDGTAVSLAPAAGGTLVVHFFATWCPDCGPELGALTSAVRACQGSPVRVVAVDVDEPPEEVKAFLGRHDVDLEVLRDPAGKAWRSAAFRGLPANLIWRAGLERRAEIGPKSEEEWRAALEALGCHAAAAPAPGAAPAATPGEPLPDLPLAPAPESPAPPEAPPDGA